MIMMPSTIPVSRGREVGLMPAAEKIAYQHQAAGHNHAGIIWWHSLQFLGGVIWCR